MTTVNILLLILVVAVSVQFASIITGIAPDVRRWWRK